MIKLMDFLNEIRIKVLSGHLTTTDKRAVKHMIEKEIWKGRVGKSDWFIKDLGKGKYDITQKIKDKGLVPVAGTKFRISTYKSTIEVK
jgi:phage-related tail protein